MRKLVHCQWGAWGSYGSCSKTCGTGTRQRSRSESPSASNGGYDCSGSSTSSEDCNAVSSAALVIILIRKYSVNDLSGHNKAYIINGSTLV